MKNAPKGTRTPDLLLRRQLLYPAELLAHMEQVMGIEPTHPAWKASVLPLNYTCVSATVIIIPQPPPFVKAFCNIFYRVSSNIFSPSELTFTAVRMPFLLSTMAEAILSSTSLRIRLRRSRAPLLPP